jgi:hypothetical protein
MKEINEEARDRYYKELGIHLSHAGFIVLQQKNGLLPLEWNGTSLCRITAGGGAQYHAEELEPDGANEAFHRATDIAAVTAEYMRLLETAPPLRAKGLEGDYRLLADFGGAVLAGHPASYGAEFVTWEWDYEHTGMWQGHYYGNNYAGAKQDFAVRSGLIPPTLIFEQEQLDDIYRSLQKTRELDDTLTYQGEQRIIKAQEHIEAISPGVQERVAAMELKQQGPQFEQTMY